MLKKIFDFLEYIFTVASLIFYTGGIVNVLAIDGLSEGELDVNQVTTDNSKFVIIKFFYQLTYLIAFLLLMRSIGKSSKIGVILLQNIQIAIIVGLTVLSTVWSELPLMTISRAIALAGTTLFGIYLANRYTLQQQLVLLAHAFIGIVLLSILFIVALPQYGLMSGLHSGAARGIYTHKNELGRLMSLGAVIFSIQPKRSVSLKPIVSLQQSIDSFGSIPVAASERVKKKNIFQHLPIYIGLVSAIVLLVLSKSSGAIVNLAVMSILIVILKIKNLKFSQKFLAILGLMVIAAIAAVVIVPNPETIFTTMGKSSDLTGRDDLWGILLDLLSKSPILGFGYGVFWEKYRPIVALSVGWNAPDAHNGFLDLALSVGLLGLVLFAISYLYIFAKSFSQFLHNQAGENIYPVVILVYIIISNISETGLFTCNNIYWLMYTTISYSVIISSKKTVMAVPKVPFA